MSDLNIIYNSDTDTLEICNYAPRRSWQPPIVDRTISLTTVEIDYDKKDNVVGLRLAEFIDNQKAWITALNEVELPDDLHYEINEARTGWRYLYGKTRERLDDLENRLSSLESDHETDPDD